MRCGGGRGGSGAGSVAVVRVNTTVPYDVHVGPGVLGEAGRILSAAGASPANRAGRSSGAGRSHVIVTNPTVAAHWLDGLEAGLGGQRPLPDRHTAKIGDGERYKTLETASCLYDFLIDRRCSRDTVILSLGGGVVSDVAGFVAATYMRGVPVVHFPTTLLAQVDASVGGKVAVDHPRGKNLIGAFHQPRAVVCDVAVLATLTEDVFREGLAEAAKTALISGEDMLTQMETNTSSLARRDPAALRELVTACVRVKAGLVEQDEHDTGPRMALNLGHTFGHAIEAADGFETVRHGAAVSVGMCVAARLAELCAAAPPALTLRTERLLSGLGLPVRLSQLPGALRASDITPHLRQDKKRLDGKQRYVLARGPGDITVASGIAENLVHAALTWAEGDDRR